MARLYGFDESTVRKIAEDHRTLMRWIEWMRQRLSVYGQCDQGVPPIEFKNESGEQVPIGGIMRITGVDENSGLIKIAKPDTSFQRLYLINVASPVSDGSTGAGTFATDNKAQALYESGTPAYGESWGPANGQWSLKKWRYGFTVLGGNKGEGDAAKTWVKQEHANYFRGVCDADHAKGDTGTVSIHDGNKVDTTDNMADVLNDFIDLELGAIVYVKWMAGKWVIYAGECEVA